MLSDFRKRKFELLFNHFDSNKSGNIDKKDFELAFKVLADKRGWKATEDKYNEVQSTLLKIWDEIEASAGTNKDGEITVNEWIAMWEKFSNNPTAAFNWQKSYCKLIFELEDVADDGQIDIDEFAAFFASFRSDDTEAKEAFKKMSQGKPNVSWDEFQKLWEEYFKSDDPSAPGNFIFGKTSL